MDLWLIRHGLPLRVDGGDTRADPGLSPEGHEQARLMAEWWGRHGVDAVYTSPMRRAIETAAPLAELLGVEPIVDEGLEEFDSHLNFYVPLEELRADEDRWKQLVDEWLSPEAEAERQRFREVVVTTVDAIAARHLGQRVAIVCHGGVINAYLSRLLHLPGTMFFEPRYTSVSRVLSGSTHKQLESVNEAPHLPDLVRPATAPK